MAAHALFRARVLDSEPLSPNLQRVRIGGDGLRDFAGTSAPDEYVRVHFPHLDGSFGLPVTGDDGRVSYPDGVDPSPSQPFTIRAWQPAADGRDPVLTLDFALHEGGTTSAWALAAAPGDPLHIGAAHGLTTVPAATRVVCVCDATGLPALERIVESVAPGTRVDAVVEVREAADGARVAASARTDADVRFDVRQGSGNGLGPSRLEEIVRDLDLPSGGTVDTFLWVAGEAKVLRGVRRYVRHELGWGKGSYAIVGYWIDDAERWRERWVEVADRIQGELEEAGALFERDEEAAMDRYDAIYEREGL